MEKDERSMQRPAYERDLFSWLQADQNCTLCCRPPHLSASTTLLLASTSRCLALFLMLPALPRYVWDVHPILCSLTLPWEKSASNDRTTEVLS